MQILSNLLWPKSLTNSQQHFNPLFLQITRFIYLSIIFASQIIHLNKWSKDDSKQSPTVKFSTVQIPAD